MARGDPTAADGDDEVLYAIFLSLMPGKTLTPTAIDQHAAHLRSAHVPLLTSTPDQLRRPHAVRLIFENVRVFAGCQGCCRLEPGVCG